MTSETLDCIELRGLKVHCIVGVYPSERHVKQPLELNVALHLDTRAAGSGGDLRDTVDYAKRAGELRFILENGRFLLLETAAEALCRYLLAPPIEPGARARVLAATVTLAKPEALGGGATASLRVHRRADEYRYEIETKPFGHVDVIFQDAHLGLYRLRVAPGASIPTHEHRVMEEAELVLGAGLLLQGRPVAPGSAFLWPRQFPHRYDNPTRVEQTILCMDRPAFLPSDEVEVPEPANGLQPHASASYYPAPASVPSSENHS